MAIRKAGAQGNSDARLREAVMCHFAKLTFLLIATGLGGTAQAQSDRYDEIGRAHV